MGQESSVNLPGMPKIMRVRCKLVVTSFSKHRKILVTLLIPQTLLHGSGWGYMLISCLSQQYSGLYLSPTLPTLLPASDIPDWCTIRGLLHDYRNPPPTDYFHILPTICSILQPWSLSTTPPLTIWAPTSLLPTSATHRSSLIMTVATTNHCHTRLPISDW